ncbi:hypothetical protein BSL78_12778 [Apostichopus japonicus]|uniref:Uncharacterized protein n=1 Tax=Stichopus japonicus TaxID=307972 RepID=A0A2G8KQS8_STIJA|nr:hypothetical protein BSL78_12778 [Apostichopus japonicus]
MQSKIVYFLLALSVLVAVAAAYEEEDELLDMMVDNYMVKRGKGKGKGRGRGKGNSGYVECPGKPHCFCLQKPDGTYQEAACGSLLGNVGL